MIDIDVLQDLAEAAPEQDAYPSALFPRSMYYRFLRLLTEWMKPKCSVELGLAGGGASLHMALGHPGGVVIGIDGRDLYRDESVAHLIKTCPNFDYWRMDSIEAVECAALRWLGTPMAPNGDLRVVSVLFIDTVHTYDRTMAEFAAWKRLLAPCAVVVLDDLLRGGMDRAWQEIPGDKIRLDLLHIGCSPTDGGFGVVFNIR